MYLSHRNALEVLLSWTLSPLIPSTGIANELPWLEIEEERTPPWVNTGADSFVEAGDIDSLPSAGAGYQDLFAFIPGAYQGNPTAGNFSLRGIGQDTILSHLNSGSNPLIVVLENGIPSSPATLRYLPPPVWGLESAQAYRGPQIHLGPSASGGALSLESRTPEFRSGGEGLLEAGEAGWFRAGLMQNIPLADGLALGISAYHEESDGFETNVFLDDPRFGATSRDHLESRLLWQPAGEEGITMDLRWIGERASGNPAARVMDSPDDGLFSRKASVNQASDYPAERLAASLRTTVPLPGHLRLRSTAGWQRLDVDQMWDLDGTDFLFWRESGSIRETRWTHHLQLEGEGGRLKWSAGWYEEKSLYDSTHDGNGGYPLPYGVPFDIEASEHVRIHGIDTKLEWELSDRWSLITGLRYQYEKRTLEASSVMGTLPEIVNSGSVSDHAWLPQAEIRWQPEPEILTGLKISRVHRAAGPGYAPSAAWVKEYDAEKGWEAEWYLIRTMESGSFTTRLYHSRISDMQIPYDVPGGFAGIDTLIANSGEATRYGAEIEARWRPEPWITLFANAGWSHTRFDELTIGPADYSGQAFPNAPEWTANTGVLIDHASGIFGSVVFSYADSTYSVANRAETTPLEPRSLLSARLGYRWGNTLFYLYGNNLLDDEYAVIRLDNPGSGITGKAGSPRVFGAGIEIHW